jgi:hypothetical protein
MMSMNLRIVFSFIFGGLGCSVLAGGVPTYEVIVIPPPAPYNAIEARKTNDLGHFVGIAGNADGGTYVYWSPESGVVPLSSPSGQIVAAAGINSSDQVPFATTVGPYVWSPTAGWVPMKSLVGAAHTQPTAINDRGQMVGFAFDGDGQDGDRTRRAVKWRDTGEVLEIRSNTEMIPNAINEHQEILSTVYRVQHGRLTYQAQLTKHLGDSVKLGDLPNNGIGKRSLAVGLSENGFAAANSPDTDLNNFVACFWNENKGMTSLGLGQSTAVGISRRGTIAGFVEQTPVQPPYSFAWNLQWGGAIDVSQHFAPGSPKFDLLQAYGISGNGIIAAAGFTLSTRNAVVLKPID